MYMKQKVLSVIQMQLCTKTCRVEIATVKKWCGNLHLVNI